MLNKKKSNDLKIIIRIFYRKEEFYNMWFVFNMWFFNLVGVVLWGLNFVKVYMFFYCDYLNCSLFAKIIVLFD